MILKIDLHIHSKYSDGVLSMSEITSILVANGVRIFSITDHDTVEGIEEAISEAKKNSLELIPGIEISSEYNQKETHIMGYYIDYKNDLLIKELNIFKKNRLKRTENILRKLETQGIILNIKELEKYVHNGVLGRPHIADLLIEKKIIKTRKEAFEKFLGKGRVAYVPREKISIEKAVFLIKQAGGIPVLAHPGFSYFSDELDKVVEYGIQGIEVWHPDHNLTLIDYYFNYAQKKDIIMTGGTDWHGDKCYTHFNPFKVPNDNILRMKALKNANLDPVF